ncbi:hypothetical protein CCHL11_08353 [Colletotrichum chlorophyti]|uniref:Uncharacterized protein n=1 Tax=Colletotrichum chlorophyti TaxID=708187 RepID=A0A1Q8RZW3_9PEZI|nr:hypothetical protein CCHL11_08353 [Colletotrichum chlorophyti]
MPGSSSNKRTSSSYPQSAYSMSASTGSRGSDTPASQTNITSYATSSDPMEKFWVTGQGTGRSSRSMASNMAQWDRQWGSISRR